MLKKLLLLVLLVCSISKSYSDDKIVFFPDTIKFGVFINNGAFAFRNIYYNNYSKNTYLLTYKIECDSEVLFGSFEQQNKYMESNQPHSFWVYFSCISNFDGEKKGRICFKAVNNNNPTIIQRDTVYFIAEMRNNDYNIIKIPDNLIGRIGDTVKIPVLLDVVQKNTANISGFEYKLSYNPSVITPADKDLRISGTFEYGVKTITISKALNPIIKSGDTIDYVDMICLLGDATFSDLVMDDFHWISTTKNDYYNFRIKNGRLKLQEIFYDDGVPRLINQKNNELLIIPSENPIGGDFSLSIRYKGTAKLQIFDKIGKVIADFSDLLPDHSELDYENIIIQKSIFSNRLTEVYFVSLSVYSQKITELLIIK